MFIEVDGQQVFALSFGTGDQTLLSHGGWIGSSEVWLPTMELLSPTWRTVAYDHRGAGATTAPLEAITYEALVDDLFRVMDALDIDRCVAGGESAGTQIVLHAALLHPERFSGMVLVDGSAGVRPPGAIPTQARGGPSTWPGADHRARMRGFIERCTPEPNIEHIRHWGLDILMRASPDAAERLWGIGTAHAAALAPRLTEVRVPSLLIRGSADVLVSPDSMEYLAAQLPESKLVIIDGAGHVPIMTRPQTVAAEIDGFFRNIGKVRQRDPTVC